MKIIRDMICVSKDELKDAAKAARMAMKYKGVDNTSADIFANIAKQKLENANGILHSREVSLIKEYNASGKTAPAAMQAVWDWEHEQLMEDAVEIEMMLKTYREA